MHITKLHLENIKCFDELSLDLTTPEGEPRMWTILVGENGTGKSTILQMVALTLAGFEAASELIYQGSQYEYVRHGASGGRAIARFRAGAGDAGAPGLLESVLVLVPGSRDLSRGTSLEDGALPPFFDQAGTEPKGWLVCGYGPMRELSAGGNAVRQPTGRERVERLSSLMGEAAALRPVRSWLQRWHYESLDEPDGPEGELARRRLEATKTALCHLLPEVASVEVGPKAVLCATPDGDLPPEALSDGYRGMFAWVGDLLGHLSEAFPHTDDLLGCEGVVLVDEIDAHLHPAWQREVIYALRETFPRLQFIVTTHSPVTIRAARADEVVVLRRAGNRVVHDEGFDSVQGWYTDQVLASDLFGLDTPYDPRIEELLSERRALLSKSGRSPEDEARLNELAASLSAVMPPPGDTPAERGKLREWREIGQHIADAVPPDELERIKARAARDLKQRPRPSGLAEDDGQ